MPKWDDPAQSHQNLVSDLSESNRNVRRALYELELYDLDPHRATTPNGRVVSRLMKELHAAILDYREFFVPIADISNEVWTQELYQVSDPLAFGETISLESLGEWRMRYQTVSNEVNDPVNGSMTTVEDVRLRIPPAAAAECYDALNEIREDLKIYFELPEQDITDLDEPLEVFDPTGGANA